MSNTKLRITEHITYTYETSDGREFEDESEAEEWQGYLDELADIVMFDHQWRKTDDVMDACYVRATTDKQVEAFNRITQKYFSYDYRLPEPGYFCFDEREDAFVNVQAQMDELQVIIETLDKAGNDNGKA